MLKFIWDIKGLATSRKDGNAGRTRRDWSDDITGKFCLQKGERQRLEASQWVLSVLVDLKRYEL